jgi:hypothetical protein
MFNSRASANSTFLVDVGGGSGHDITQLLGFFGSETPGKLILQDRPEIIELSKKDGNSNIVKMVHDFLTEQPTNGA